jgi:predicted dehydrogenase
MAAEVGGGCAVFTSLSAALAHGDFDAVDLMLLHTDHEAAAKECFAAGKHVLMEKPMATSVAECNRIMAAAASSASETVFMISEQSQYWAPVVKAKDLVESGSIGDVVSVRAVYRGAPAVWTDVLDGAGGTGDKKGVSTDQSGAPKPWRYDLRLTGGGVTIDGGAHWLRPMSMLTPGRSEWFLPLLRCLCLSCVLC